MSTIFRTSSMNSLRRLSLVSRSITRRHRPSSRKSRSPDSHRGFKASHLFAGVLGGSLVLVGGYTWYYFSPLRPIVETTPRVQQNFKDNIQGHAIETLRTTVKSIVAVVPLAGTVVDAAFDALENILEQHQEEIGQMATKALQEVQRLAESGTDRTQTALAVMESMKVFFGEIQALYAKAGTTVGPSLEKAYAEISGFAKRVGPEVKQEIDRRMAEAYSVLSQGSLSILRTVEKAAWSLKSSGKTDEKHSRNETNSEEEKEEVGLGERK
ncbi:hypothetical protein C0993_006679 [Termitomyces sp. T159_Od127]|nr:hypothetical protein C0993_006679 [Termitomyces sp. T159_Od127]